MTQFIVFEFCCSIPVQYPVWDSCVKFSSIYQSIAGENRSGVHRIQFWKKALCFSFHIYMFLLLTIHNSYYLLVKMFLCCFTIWCFIEKWELKLFKKRFVTTLFEIYIFILLLYIYNNEIRLKKQTGMLVGITLFDLNPPPRMPLTYFDRLKLLLFYSFPSTWINCY